MSLLVRLGTYIRTKEHFVRISSLFFGLGGGLMAPLFFPPFNPGMIVIGFFLGLPTGWLWGFVMWHVWYLPLVNSMAARSKQHERAAERGAP
jgi:hypothetical protein